MIPYNDITVVTDNAYKLAELINGGSYNSIFYYEFHEEVDANEIYNCFEGLKVFRERSQEFYKIFISHMNVDDTPSLIHIALKVGDDWFISYDCGSNYYLGYAPTGILKLREACAKRNITAFASYDKFDEWIKRKFGNPRKTLTSKHNDIDTLQFEKLCKALRFLTVDMQRRPDQFKNLTEENIRDRMLTQLNVLFKGRGHAESKNCKGKTDILIRTKDGLNEHIFELKIWGGIKTLKLSIEQILGYISWHNNFCGILILSYNKSFTKVLKEAEEYFQLNYSLDKRIEILELENEFRFKLTHRTDIKRSIQVQVNFINLRC